MVPNLLGAIRVRLFLSHPGDTQMAGKPGWQAAEVWRQRIQDRFQ
jgi:hypothetical protein